MTVNRTSVKQKNVGLFLILKWQFFYITDSFVFSDLIPFDIVSCAIMRIQSHAETSHWALGLGNWAFGINSLLLWKRNIVKIFDIFTTRGER